jgi:hypothetical protein
VKFGVKREVKREEVRIIQGTEPASFSAIKKGD